MHYVGMHGLSGDFAMEHEPLMVILSVLISVGAAYGGLRVFLARQDGVRLRLSAAAFGVAVSGMHYTAMYGTHFVPLSHASPHSMAGLAASQQILALVVAVLCFVIAAGFLLSLVPDPRRKMLSASLKTLDPVSNMAGVEFPPSEASPVAAAPRLRSVPLGGIGQPQTKPTTRLPVEGADGTHFIDNADVRSIRADAHYTRIHDGTRERMCPWSISEAEAQLDPGMFVRVHRSYIVAIPHVTFVRREGEGR